MSGDAAKFDVTGQLAALKRYAWSLTRDESEAEDLVQDTLVRAYERRHTFREDGDLKSWLFSVLHNTFVSRLRSRRADAARLDRAAQLAETSAGPAQETQLRLTQIRSAFLSLPAEQREVLHLVAIEGMAYGEAAAALGVPVGTLMSRLGRARATLRALENSEPAKVVTLRVIGGNDDKR